MKLVAIFASGNGSNAERIIKHFKGHQKVKFQMVLSNRSDAPVINRAKKLGVNTLVFSKSDLSDPNNILFVLKKNNIDFIVLAGFLWKIPESIIRQYPDRIINIHPALLPDFGGKGMYGMRVHESVIETGKQKSGITIHYVNEHYDKGRIIFQAECIVNKNDTPQSLAAKIHKLEYEHFPVVIEKIICASTFNNSPDC